MAEHKKPSLPMNMVLSALAGCGAATACHPLDVIRVQLQIDSEGGAKREYKNGLDAARKIYSKNGLRQGLYAGLSAAYLRQWLYGSCRMGFFTFMMQGYKDANNNKAPILPMKMAMGGVSGAIGACVGTPSELALVRMGADKRLPEAQRRNYKNVFECVYRIGSMEGIPALWTGATVTCIRAALMGSALMGVTSEVKANLNQWALDNKYNHILTTEKGKEIPLVFCSALVGSFAANCIVMPADVIKSRIQNMPAPTADKPAIYSGMVDCAKKSIKAEGPLVLWKGFGPAFVKLAPYSVISLTLLDKLMVAFTGSAAL